MSHPTVGVALCGSNVSEKLSSSCEKLPVSKDNVAIVMLLVVAHRNVGLVANEFLRSHVSGEMLSSLRQELRKNCCTCTVG